LERSIENRKAKMVLMIEKGMGLVERYRRNFARITTSI
jgi:hypothetical protein